MSDRAYDVVVIAGNPGGCSAAIAAARSGCSVLLLEATRTLGGMNANGTFGFDCATAQALSGIAEEVAQRIRDHYSRIGLDDPLFRKRADLVWESHVAAQVWADITAETPGLEVITGAVVTGVRMQGRRIAQILWEPAVDPMGNLPAEGTAHGVRARIVIDASYEADVAAWSGVPCRLGREARSVLEPHAGKVYFSNQDVAKTGHWLPHSVLPGSTGEADDTIMAFASRLHCRLYEDPSPQAKHRLREPPPGYDPSLYDWGPVAQTAEGEPVYFNTLYVLVNGKYLLNRMVRGNNLVGPNREYILAHPRERRALRQRFIDHALGYLYYVQNEGGLPQLGLADDEFTDNGHVPYQIYVREGRRIEGLDMLTEADVNPFITGDGMRPPRKPDSIGIADWTYESQGCADEAPPGYKYPDGYIIGRATRAPYQIPYGCLLPTAVDNLLVCGGISATHIALGAVRCEGARIANGIAAGIAAGLCVSTAVRPADLPVERLQTEIIRRGGKLTYFSDVPSDHPDFASIQWAALRGMVPADPDWCFGPDVPVTWAEFAHTLVRVWRIPVSVTGVHFEQIGPRDPAYRDMESLYDLGSRSGIDLFGVGDLADEDPMQEFLRLFPRSKRIALSPGLVPQIDVAERFLAGVAQAMGMTLARSRPGQHGTAQTMLTRAALGRLLQQAASESA